VLYCQGLEQIRQWRISIAPHPTAALRSQAVAATTATQIGQPAVLGQERVLA
jgi:hypothetical protein